MKAKLTFIAKALTISILLFLLWSQVESSYGWLIAKDATFLRELFAAEAVESAKVKSAIYLIPFLSVILSASDLAIKDKLRWATIGFVVFLLFDIITVATGIAAFAEQSFEIVSEISVPLAVTVVIQATLLRILPFLLLFLALKGKLYTLWLSPDLLTLSRICPICGKGTAGLVQHISSVHGNRALNNWKVRRYLARINHS